MKKADEQKNVENKQKVIKKIKRFEKQFSANAYDGKGSLDYVIKKGTISVMISAPHAVNHFRSGKVKYADMMTGGIAQYLHTTTGCHLMFAGRQAKVDPNYDSASDSDYKTYLKEYVEKNEIQVLIELHGASKERDYAVEMGTVDDSDSSLHEYKFISKLVEYSFDFQFKSIPEGEKKEIWKNKIFNASYENTITNYISSKTNTACIQLEINGMFRDLANEDKVFRLISGLKDIISIVGNMDLNAKKIMVYRAGQSTDHKPQDKVELFFPDKNDIYSNMPFQKGEFLNICIPNRQAEQVRVHTFGIKMEEKIKNTDLAGNDKYKEYIFLTNRLIFTIFNREWIDGQEEKSGIEGKPVILYQYDKQQYTIGIPAANKLSNIMMSSKLYSSMQKYADAYNFMVYNKYSDIRMYIEFDKANYDDKGRISSEKVMIPRYYKVLLGYLEYPLTSIREEEYENILNSLDKEKVDCFNRCYECIRGESLYRLKSDENSDIEDLRRVIDAQMNMKLLEKIEILRTPKEIHKKFNLKKKIKEWNSKIMDAVLQKFVGYSEYMLRASWTVETDDKTNVARLSTNLMNVLGVSENDKVIVCFGKKHENLRVLVGNYEADYIVGIPAPARQRLGMNSVNDVVVVKRDMWHTFMRHSVQQGITFLGTILTVVQLMQEWKWRLIICTIIFPIMIYWVLSEERVKVK